MEELEFIPTQAENAAPEKAAADDASENSTIPPIDGEANIENTMDNGQEEFSGVLPAEDSGDAAQADTTENAGSEPVLKPSESESTSEAQSEPQATREETPAPSESDAQNEPTEEPSENPEGQSEAQAEVAAAASEDAQGQSEAQEEQTEEPSESEAEAPEEKKLSEEELAPYRPELEALEAELEKNPDLLNVPDTLIIENVDDSELLADEVGVSGVYDEFGREILDPVFENRLRMSRNAVKLAYSKLKNTILSYRDMNQKFAGERETFSRGGKVLFIIEIGEGSVLFYAAADPATLDKEVFSHQAMIDEAHTGTPSMIIVSKETERVEVTSIEKALKLIEKVMADENVAKLKAYAPTAYSQRYPYNFRAVLRGKEKYEPEEGLFDNPEYQPIEGEITMDIIKQLMPPDFSIEDKKGRPRLEAMRQQATTIKGAVAMAEPIVYFYDSAVNSDNTIAYINVQQVLNDKFMGKILPQQFFAVAEASDRIVDINLLAVKQVAADCNENPKFLFATRVSAKLLSKAEWVEKLVKESKTENNNLILAFDCDHLETIGEDGFKGITALKQNDVRIMLDGTEHAGLRVLTEYPIDFLRFDSRYYQENIKSTVAHLDMLTGFAKVMGIMTTSVYVETTKMARFLQSHNVEQIQGPVVCEPKRTIYNAVKDVKKLPTANK